MINEPYARVGDGGEILPFDWPRPPEAAAAPDEPVYCEECEHINAPELDFPTCRKSPEKRGRIAFVRRCLADADLRPSDARRYYDGFLFCHLKNTDGHCPDHKPKEK